MAVWFSMEISGCGFTFRIYAGGHTIDLILKFIMDLQNNEGCMMQTGKTQSNNPILTKPV